MLTLTQLGRFLLDDSFSREAIFLGSPLLFEHEQLHDWNGKILEDEFGMGDVKIAGINVRGASHARSPVLSMRRIDLD